MEIRDKRGSRGASVPNRVRFIKRAKANVRRIVDEALQGKSIITDPGNSKQVSIPIDGIDEPFIRKSNSGGDRNRVFPGNEKFTEGDRIARPSGGSGDGGMGTGDTAGKGDATDSFQFVISREEFLELFFEDCELPNLKKQTAGETDLFIRERSGFSKSGSPSQMDLVRTMRQSLGRRIALGRPKLAELNALEEAVTTEEAKHGESELLRELREQLARLKIRYFRIPFIEPDHDVRFRRFERTPKPILRAVMFCLMDVSGSMTEERKNCAKRFFLLLRLFLENRYKRVDVVFIRHTDRASEVDEETFFLSQETGGTAVSSAIEEMRKIIRVRYASEWNMYVAQASDGDNDRADTTDVVKLLTEVLPVLQYYAYIEVGEQSHPSILWRAYEKIRTEHFAMQRVENPEDIIRVFYRLFGRDNTMKGVSAS